MKKKKLNKKIKKVSCMLETHRMEQELDREYSENVVKQLRKEFDAYRARTEGLLEVAREELSVLNVKAVVLEYKEKGEKNV